MSRPSDKLYEFGSFRLDPDERVLLRGEELFVLPPKVFDTLFVLIEREGRVVSKSELMEAIWADAFVEESNLSQNIYTLRRTLGVDEQGRRFIETVPRRGYRFAVPVRIRAKQAGERLQAGVNEHVTANSNAEFAQADVETSSYATVTDDSLPSTIPPEAKRASEHPRFAARNAVWASLGIMIAVGLSLLFSQFAVRREEKRNSPVAPIEQIRFQKLTDSGDVISPTISPNGELLAYVRHEQEEESVWVKQIATGSAVQTLPPSRKGYGSLAFSPDGRYLFFREQVDGGGIYRTSVFGGPAKKVADNVWSGFSVSPDGERLAFVRRDPSRNVHLLILSNIDGSGERELSVRQTPLDYRGTSSWSPDGSTIAVAGGLQNQSFPKLLTVEVATGKETELKTPRWRAIQHALWTPSGKHLIVSAREGNESYSQLWMLGYPDGEIRRLTNDLESYFWVSLSADGRMLVTRQQRIVAHLWLLPDGDSNKARQLTFGGRNLDGFVGLAWTPDGKIVASMFSGNVTDLYSMNADGSNRVQLTANAGMDNSNPVVSPDGRYIVFTSNRTGAAQLWRMDNDGRNQKQLTFGEEQNESAQDAAISPNGLEVFFLKHGAGPPTIWKSSIEGGAAVQVSRLTNGTPEGYLSISPDGRWLAYRHVSAQPEARSEEPTTRIGVLPTDGGGEPKLFDLPMRQPIVQWSADSAAFDYAAGSFNSSSLWRQHLSGSKPEKLTDLPDRIFNFAWSRDRKNLVVSRGKQQGDAILITNLP